MLPVLKKKKARERLKETGVVFERKKEREKERERERKGKTLVAPPPLARLLFSSCRERDQSEKRLASLIQ